MRTVQNSIRLFFLLAAAWVSPFGAAADSCLLPPSITTGPLSGAKVVNNLARKEEGRAQPLRHYESTRVYPLSYRGFEVAESLCPLCIFADEIVHDLVHRQWRRCDGRREQTGIGAGPERAHPCSCQQKEKSDRILDCTHAISVNWPSLPSIVPPLKCRPI